MLIGVGAAGMLSAVVAASFELVGLRSMPIAWLVILAVVSELLLVVGRVARRPRVQFRLRTLMIVTTLLAMACGYVGSQAKVVRDRQAVLADVEKAGGGFFSDNHTDSGFWNRFPVWPAGGNCLDRQQRTTTVPWPLDCPVVARRRRRARHLVAVDLADRGSADQEVRSRSIHLAVQVSRTFPH